MRKENRGFTLIELMIVVAIIAIIAAIAIPSLLRSRMSANQNNAGAGLKQICTHEAVWRTQDTDKNGSADYWTKDVAGFHAIRDANAKAVAFVDLAFGRADQAVAFTYPELGGIIAPKQGYYFRAMSLDQDGATYVPAAGTAASTASPSSGICTNAARFGFTSYPRVYNSDGVLHFMVNEDGVIWQKDTGNVTPVGARAPAAPPGSDTTWSQFGG